MRTNEAGVLREAVQFICYFITELDPFAGKWLGVSPRLASLKSG